MAENPDPRYKQILESEKSKPLVVGFAIISLTDIVTFAYDRDVNEFKFSYLSLKLAETNLRKNETMAPPVCAMSIIADYKNQYFK